MALEERARRKAAVEDALKAGYPPPDQAQRQGSSALQQASITLNLAYGTISTWLKRERQHKASGEEHYEPDWSLYRVVKPKVTITAAMQQGAVPLPWESPDSRDTQRLRDEVQRLRTELKGLQREANASDDLREAVFDLAQSPLNPPSWVFDDEPANHPAGVPLLFGSDEQFGEVIRSDEVNGINEFNVDIAARRIRRKFERTVDICFNHMVNPDYPGIVYCRGGDAVSGDIHQELRETNELTSHEQLLHLAELEVAGIRALLDHFPRVVVLSVPGNHGRTTIKPVSKRYSDTNYDRLCALFIEREFKGDDRVVFYTPKSGDAYFSVYGKRFLLTHGDRIGSRGGQGFIGPVATIARGVHKTRQQFDAINKPVDYMLIGHFHTLMQIAHCFVNGSVPGFSEYANQLRFSPEPPQQWLLFVHPRRGITCRWPIQLEDEPGHDAPWFDCVA